MRGAFTWGALKFLAAFVCLVALLSSCVFISESEIRARVTAEAPQAIVQSNAYFQTRFGMCILAEYNISEGDEVLKLAKSSDQNDYSSAMILGSNWLKVVSLAEYVNRESKLDSTINEGLVATLTYAKDCVAGSTEIFEITEKTPAILSFDGSGGQIILITGTDYSKLYYFGGDR